MAKRQTNVVTFRLDSELRTLLEEAAARQDVTVTKFLQTLVKEAVKSPTLNRFQQTAGIPNRILEVERWFGLTIIDSARTLGLGSFGIESVRDLATPDKLLEQLDTRRLDYFAQTYEVSPDWLLTGRGEIYKCTHNRYDIKDFVVRLTELWRRNKLLGVRLVSNRSKPSLREPTPVIVALKIRHPVAVVGEHISVYESWPIVVWNEGSSTLYQLLRFCLALYYAKEEKATEVYPAGVSLVPEAFEDLMVGNLHLVQALKEQTKAWNPEVEYEALKTKSNLRESLRNRLESAEAWSELAQLVEKTLQAKARFDFTFHYE